MEEYKQNLMNLVLNPSSCIKKRDNFDIGKQYPYAIVDSAVDKMIVGHFASDEPEHWILYDGTDAGDLEMAAPYLVKLDLKNEFTCRVFEEGYGKNWGCFVLSELEGSELAEHLKQYTKIYSREFERDVYIRFYDPRAMFSYFSCFNETETVDFFKGIFALMVNDVFDSEKLFSYYQDNRVVKKSKIILSDLKLSIKMQDVNVRA